MNKPGVKTIVIDEKLHRQLKVYASSHGQLIQTVVEAAIREKITNGALYKHNHNTNGSMLVGEAK